MTASEEEPSKENQTPVGKATYRSVFAVLTLDSVLVYDTHQTEPLAVIRGLHYAGLTDCCWGKDGKQLMVCSTDGYISIISFEDGELGEVFTPPAPTAVPQEKTVPKPSLPTPSTTSTIPPCEPGQAAVLEAPPAKRAKKTRVTPTLVSSIGASKENIPGLTSPAKRPSPQETDSDAVGDAVNKLTLGNGVSDMPPAKKKKRIQPVLVTT